MKEWKHRCLRSVLAYRPDPLKPDRVTVGFVLFDTAAGSTLKEARFSPDLRSLRCIAPQLELETIEATLSEIEPEIRSVIANVTDAQKYSNWLPDSIPDEIELLPPTPILSNDFEQEVIAQSNQLFRSPDESELDERQRSRREYGRLYLQREIRHWCDEFGVWPHLEKRIAVESFLLRGDTYRIECGYLDKSAKTYRMLDAVSLITSLDRARILSLGWQSIRRGMAEMKGVAGCELIAIVEDGLNRQFGKAKDAWSWMEDAGIKVEVASSLPALAAQARSALRL